MPFSGIADSEELKILTTALDDYCRDNGIDPSSPERHGVGRIIVSLFDSGARSAEDLRAALATAMHRKGTA